MSEKTEARQTPLPDLLDRVPDDIVLGIPGDEPMFPSYTNIPIGKMAQEAAAELRRLSAENERIGPLTERVLELKAQRGALLEVLRKHVELHDGDCICEDCAAIKAVEGEKT